MFRPLNGWAAPYSVRAAMSPGISCSASVSSFRPNSANPMSFHLGVGHSGDGLGGAKASAKAGTYKSLGSKMA